jgi:hypothetical protein
LKLVTGLQCEVVNVVCGTLKSETSQDYAQKPQRNCTFMNLASGRYQRYNLQGGRGHGQVP